MIKFKQFVTESQFKQEFIHTLPDALEIHLKHTAAGIPLPDRNDLYRIHPKGAIRYNKPDGGMVQFHAGDLNGEHAYASHVNKADEPHRDDGPSFISKNRLTWYKNGEHIGDAIKMMGHTEFFGDKGAFTKEDFNKHLTSHGYPEYHD